MKKLWIIFLVVMMSSAVKTPVLAAKPSNVVTHQELASILVNLLGLSKQLPANPSNQERFNALMLNGISPEAGWTVDKNVTRADLARVVVQAMGLAAEVKKPSDPNSWVQVAKANGIPVDTVGQAADQLSPLSDPGTQIPNFGLSTDPLEKGSIASETPDPVLGLAREEVLDVISGIVVLPPLPPVTPN